jgi:hypothetical protein
VEFHVEDHPDPLDIDVLEAQIRQAASAAMGLGDEIDHPYGGMADHRGWVSLKPASGLVWRDGGLAMGPDPVRAGHGVSGVLSGGQWNG